MAGRLCATERGEGGCRQTEMVIEPEGGEGERGSELLVEPNKPWTLRHVSLDPTIPLPPVSTTHTLYSLAHTQTDTHIRTHTSVLRYKSYGPYVSITRTSNWQY